MASPTDLLALQQLQQASLATNHTPEHVHEVYLRPIISMDTQNCVEVDGEVIASGQIRPGIMIRSTDPAPTVLGRNHTTKIADVTISRAICELYVTNDGKIKMRMRKRAQSHRLRVDGAPVTADLMEEIVLAPNSRVALSDEKYEYQLFPGASLSSRDLTLSSMAHGSFEGIATAKSGPAAAGSSNAGALKGQPKETNENESSKGDEEPASLRAAKRLMVDELTCALCMDIMVRAHAASPCGHMLCGPCADRLIKNKSQNVGPAGILYPLKGAVSLADCPHCREGITEVTWMRSLDNVIWGMVLRGDFEKDDVQHYLERSGRKPSEEEMELIFGKKSKKLVKAEPLDSDQYLQPMKKRKVVTAASGEFSHNSMMPIQSIRPNNAQTVGMATAANAHASLASGSTTITSSPCLIDLNVGNCNDDAICID